MMGRLSRRRFWVLPALLAVFPGLVAIGPSPDRRPKRVLIGVLATGHIDPVVFSAFETQLEASLPEMSGRLTMTRREASFSKARLVAEIDEMMSLHPDLLVCLDLDAATAASSRRLDTYLPIVFLAHADPLANHLIQSYSHPGNNLTGVTTYRCVDGKMLEILADAFPSRKRFGYFVDSTVDDTDCIQIANDIAARIQVELVKIDVSVPEFVANLSMILRASNLQGVVAPASAPLWQNRRAVVATVNELRLPAIYESDIFLKEGGLMSYGPIRSDAVPQMVNAVIKILHGESAGGIPVEQPTLFELVVNLHAPHVPEYEVRASTLRRADRILE